MATLDGPQGNQPNDYDPNPFDKEYENACQGLSLEKSLSLRTTVDMIEKMDKSQLISYAKVITAQKFKLECVYASLMKGTL